MRRPAIFKAPSGPDALLFEPAWHRAPRSALGWSLGSFPGLLWLAAAGAAGGVLGGRIYTGAGWVWAVAVPTATTVLGVVFGYLIAAAAAIPLVARRQRDEARKRVRSGGASAEAAMASKAQQVAMLEAEVASLKETVVSTREKASELRRLLRAKVALRLQGEKLATMSNQLSFGEWPLPDVRHGRMQGPPEMVEYYGSWFSRWIEINTAALRAAGFDDAADQLNELVVRPFEGFEDLSQRYQRAEGLVRAWTGPDALDKNFSELGR